MSKQIMNIGKLYKVKRGQWVWNSEKLIIGDPGAIIEAGDIVMLTDVLNASSPFRETHRYVFLLGKKCFHVNLLDSEINGSFEQI